MRAHVCMCMRVFAVCAYLCACVCVANIGIIIPDS